MERGVQLVCDRCGNWFTAGEPFPISQQEGLVRSNEESVEKHSDADSAETHSCLAHANLTYDYDRLRESVDSFTIHTDDIWTYLPLLPVSGDQPVTLGEGATDCVTADRLGDRFGLTLRLKLEGQQPSGSTKDRGSAVLATYAREQGHDVIACASTGNAAASIAAYAARGGLDCTLYVPESIPQTKALQPEIYGATVNRIDGSYTDAYRACATSVLKEGWLDRSAGASPFTAAGARTLGYELAADCPDADWVVVPMGNGGTIAGAWNGLAVAGELGFIKSTPRMLGVQTQSATTIHNRFHDQTAENTQAETATTHPQKTCADSIDVEVPHRVEAACQALEQSGGTSVVVSDEEILDSLRTLGRTEGIFAEPASASVIAGIQQARNQGAIERSDVVVGVLTGSGLKDGESAQRALARQNTN